MTPDEIEIHWSRFLDKIPILGDMVDVAKKLQQLYDFDLKYMTSRNIGYTEELHLRNLKKFLAERTGLNEQIRAEVFLKFLEDQEPTVEQKSEPVDFTPLLNFSKGGVNKETLDHLLRDCGDHLGRTNFDLRSYAALYLTIFEKYRNRFKRDVKFADVQRMFDQYFEKDTHTYKPGKLKKKVEELKTKYDWFDKL